MREKQETIKGKLDILCAFDYEKDLYRYDFSRPEAFLGDGGRETITPSTRKYVRNAKQQICYNSVHPGHVNVYRPDEKEMVAGAPRLDVRLFGFMFESELTSGRTLEESLRLRESYCDLCEATKESGSLFRLSWIAKSKYGRYSKESVWINESQGFAPVRMDSRMRDPGSEDSWTRPGVLNESEWTCVNSVWVPCKLRLVSHDVSGPSPKFRTTYDLTFVWDSVNQPVNPDFFTAKGIDIDHPAIVVDTRPSKPIVTGMVGRSDGAIPFPLKPRHPFSLTRVLLAAATGIVALAALIYAWRRVLRRREVRC